MIPQVAVRPSLTAVRIVLAQYSSGAMTHWPPNPSRPPSLHQPAEEIITAVSFNTGSLFAGGCAQHQSPLLVMCNQ